MIEIEKLSKHFGGVRAVDDVTFQVKRGDLFTLLGPSGCGKSTTLRCIAGLEKPDSGEILVEGKILTSVKKKVFLTPEQRRVGMVFQSYAIWPHMTVFNNVKFPLMTMRFPKSEIKKRVEEMLFFVELEGLGNRYPSELSGGQQQRVALARALIHEPKVLLLDEPLSNLDAKLRTSMRSEIKKLQKKLGLTTIYVTHDQVEAFAISDIIALMNEGKIVQMGDALDLYEHPQTKFTATFIGRTNLFAGNLITENVVSDGKEKLYEVNIDNELKFVCSSDVEPRLGDQVYVSIRPENIQVVNKGIDEKENLYQGKVKNLILLGNTRECTIQLSNNVILTAHLHPDIHLWEGRDVLIHIKAQHCRIIRG